MVASALANHGGRDLFVVCATLEEAGRVQAQMEVMGWQSVHFYPTAEASPYEPFDPETELSWGQMQVLADLVTEERKAKTAIIATVGSLQPHLPPPAEFKSFCLK